ncbi:hypothetical protein ABBQ32_000736 [Trebouxia sp. C0010 RCD-2024]
MQELDPLISVAEEMEGKLNLASKQEQPSLAALQHADGRNTPQRGGLDGQVAGAVVAPTLTTGGVAARVTEGTLAEVQVAEVRGMMSLPTVSTVGSQGTPSWVAATSGGTNCSVRPIKGSKGPKMMFNAELAVSGGHVPARALVDTGATHCYVSEAFLAKTNLQARKQDTWLSLANGMKAISKGKAVLPLDI